MSGIYKCISPACPGHESPFVVCTRTNNWTLTVPVSYPPLTEADVRRIVREELEARQN